MVGEYIGVVGRFFWGCIRERGNGLGMFQGHCRCRRETIEILGESHGSQKGGAGKILE